MKILKDIQRVSNLTISELGKNHLTGWVKLSSEFVGVVMMGFREEGWEHVSIAPKFRNKQPNWEDMCEIKNMFWTNKEDVVQLHPRDTDYVHSVSYRGQKREDILHLWRPASGNWDLMNEGSRPTSISDLIAETPFETDGSGLYAINISSESFVLQENGKKNFEVCKKDREREYAFNDTLILKEVNLKTGKETGRALRRRVTSVSDFEQKKDYVVLGTAPVVSMDPYSYQEMLDVKLIWKDCPYDVLKKIHTDKRHYPRLNFILFNNEDKSQQIKAQSELLRGLQYPELIEVVH